jgi:putative transposase
MSKTLGVSKSGYYKWLKFNPLHESKKSELLKKIQLEFEASKDTYGSPRITIELNKKGISISKTTVARNMKMLKIKARNKKKFVATTDSKHDYVVCENHLNRQFVVDHINRVWVSDITYIPVGNDFYYLTVIMDLCDKMIVAWTLSKNMTTTDTTLSAFKLALKNRNINKDNQLLFHSDRGVQYAAHEFKNALKEYNITQSMSRKGNCWDNAPSESFFKTIKIECLDKYIFTDSSTLRKFIFRYIDGWYNTVRSHSALNYKSPMQVFYEQINKLAA